MFTSEGTLAEVSARFAVPASQHLHTLLVPISPTYCRSVDPLNTPCRATSGLVCVMHADHRLCRIKQPIQMSCNNGSSVNTRNVECMCVTACTRFSTCDVSLGHIHDNGEWRWTTDRVSLQLDMYRLAKQMISGADDSPLMNAAFSEILAL